VGYREVVTAQRANAVLRGGNLSGKAPGRDSSRPTLCAPAHPGSPVVGSGIYSIVEVVALTRRPRHLRASRPGLH
jgi:hypothetical protein